MGDSCHNQAPWWFVLVVVISELPVVGWPVLISRLTERTMEDVRILMMLYPIYAVVSGYMAFKVYRERPYLSWILLMLLWLSYGAVGVLL